MFKCKKFSRTQVLFCVEVMIASFVDNFTSCFPARWLDGGLSRDKQWRKDMKDAKKCWDYNSFHQATLNQLSWNLSILVAQIDKQLNPFHRGDGMGCSDALEDANLCQKLEKWMADYMEGSVGILPYKDDPACGSYNGIDVETLAKDWLDEVSQYYNLGK